MSAVFASTRNIPQFTIEKLKISKQKENVLDDLETYALLIIIVANCTPRRKNANNRNDVLCSNSVKISYPFLMLNQGLILKNSRSVIHYVVITCYTVQQFNLYNWTSKCHRHVRTKLKQ
jgi:hypothetical protein